MYVPKRKNVLLDLEEADADFIEKEVVREQQATGFLRRESNVPRLEEAAKDYTYKAMKLIVSENITCIDRDILMQIARENEKRTLGLLSLPFSILFFLLFAISAFMHEDVLDVYTIESGIRNTLGSGVAAVTSTEDAWDWLNNTFFPAVFIQTDAQGTPLPDKADWSRLLSYNYLQGPVVIEQQRSTKGPCDDDSNVATDMLCYPMGSTDTTTFGRGVTPVFSPPQASDYAGGTVTAAERKAWLLKPFKAVTDSGRRLDPSRAGIEDRLPGTTGTNAMLTKDAFRASFYSNTPYQQHQERLNFMRSNGWLDKQTKFIIIRADFLNAEIQRPRLESLKLVLSFPRSGEVYTKFVLDTLFLKFWSTGTSLGADIVYVLLLAGITCYMFADLMRQTYHGRLLATVKTGWFVLQTVIILYGWLVVAGYAYVERLVGKTKSNLLDLQTQMRMDLPAEQNTMGEKMVGAAADASYLIAWLRILVAQYHLILMIRFFVAFRAQPRLGVVVNTIEVCLIDIFHFMMVLVPVWLAYAISACFVFGRRLGLYSNIQDAMGETFQILVEQNYDWLIFTEENWWTSALWAWSYMLFLTVLLINMILAIVLDAYSEQRKLVGKSESIFETLQGFWMILKNWKHWVSNKVLLERLEKLPRMFTREEFLKEFPGMAEAQLNMLMNAAQLRATNVNTGPRHMQHTMRMALAMKVAMDKVSDEINELDSGSYQPVAEDPKGEITKASWITELSQELASQNHCMLTLQWRLQQLNWAWQALDAAHGKGATFNLAAARAKQEEEKVL